VADVERTLLWKAINSGDFMEVVARGIEAEHFADEECRELYDFAMDFSRIHKEPPSIKVVKSEFPDFKAAISQDPLSYHMERFILKVKERMAIELVRDYHDSIEDPDALIDIELRAFDMARRLSEVVPAPQAHRFSDGQKRIAKHDMLKERGDHAGIYMGIPTMDEVLLGFQPGQLITIVAYMGIGKSILMAYFAYSAYLQGKTTLFISLEMDADEIFQRIDTMATNVRIHALKALELNVGERKKWEQVLKKAEEDKHERDIIVRDDIQNCTVNHVFAETSRVKPDLVCVDYLELMSVPRVGSGYRSQGWEQVSEAGKGLKQNARLLKIPHITAAQLNREGGRDKVTLANVGHQSIGKHSDMMLGLSQDEDQEDSGEMELISLKIRNGKKPRSKLRWNLDTMDIGEKGLEERFPSRKPLSSSKRQYKRRSDRRLEIARNVGDKPNPFSLVGKAA